MEARKLAAESEAAAKLYTLGAPKYRVEVTADDYRKAEDVLDKIVKFTTEAWADQDGKIEFSRT